ncbi:hypothetical protein N0V82_007522 [Gnomoniopsis sp. IMI 355080]|nr:hypothetical protein N0V82_007522 [Gnomoniopsis sp. IMI 355080]
MSHKPIPLVSYRFEYDKEFFNPHQRANGSLTGEVPADSIFTTPTENTSWEAVRRQLGANPLECKLFFIKYITQNPEFANPGLTEPYGRDQAKRAGALLRDTLLAAGFGAQPSMSFYTSSLKRCISTTEELILDSQLANRIIVADGFREWMGYDHVEFNDRRATRTEILKDTGSRGFKTDFLGDFPEQDEMFQRRPLREAYTDVDVRWEDSLNTIFETDSNSIICICSNNRAIQSCFRVMGHEADATVLQSNFGIMNMRNGAVVALLVTRVAIKPEEASYIQNARTDCRKMEFDIIKRQKKLQDEKAVGELCKLTKEKFKDFLLTVGIDQEREVRRTYEKSRTRDKTCYHYA